jgi:long-chain acyl-CoA synthetase
MATAPWISLYPEGVGATIEPRAVSMLEAWRASVRRCGGSPALYYFGCSLTFDEIDALADALAVALETGGTARNDRVGIYLQNDPQWVIATVAAWKLGAIPVALNPMLKSRELRHHLDDAGVTTLIALEALYRSVAVHAIEGSSVSRVIATHPLDLTPDAEVPEPMRDLVGEKAPVDGTDALRDLLDRYRGQTPEVAEPGGEDVAMLTYTSGTTGQAKGGMNLHAGMVHSSQVYVEWFDLDENDVVLGVAPLFHITGSVASMGVTILCGAPLVLGHRFDPAETLRCIEEHGCTYGIGAITAFIAMINEPSLPDRDLSSLVKVGSGGAPISPSVVTNVRQKSGLRIHPVYGLTETTSPTHLTPPGAEPPVDPSSGALAVGIPGPGVEVRIVDIETGRDVAVGDAGEVVIRGPMVVPGYWDQPEASAHAIRDGWLFTGDVGVVDEQGWLFIVDRKKDLINAGGYKVWPREVEDVLYEHPEVREAAVVGVADDYRGETVKAVVSVVAGATVSVGELAEFCRERLAAYKYPRIVEIVDDLPKTPTGKLLRRELR